MVIIPEPIFLMFLLLQCGTLMRPSAYTFETNYNTAGVKCTVYDLPDEGIYGNDHILFQDTNNDLLANHIEKNELLTMYKYKK